MYKSKAQQPAITLDFPAVGDFTFEDWEQYAKDKNWGILGFPHILANGSILPSSDEDLGISDYNDKDRYRFLYLWRTYVCNPPYNYLRYPPYHNPWGNITYKVILK